jgi:hypothetical protein
MKVYIPIHIKRFMMILIAALVLLGICHLTSIILRFMPQYIDIQGVTAFIQWFDLDTEGNIPTWYSSTLLLLCSGLMFLIANLQDVTSQQRYWLGLAIVFLILSLDEAAAIHEHLNGPVRSLLNSEDYLYFAWVIPGIFFVGLLGVIYWRFLLEFPAKLRNFSIVAAIMYITGAIGFEIPGSYFYRASGLNSYTFIAVSTIEELLEMGGIILFIYVLLTILTNNITQVKK